MQLNPSGNLNAPAMGGMQGMPMQNMGGAMGGMGGMQMPMMNGGMQMGAPGFMGAGPQRTHGRSRNDDNTLYVGNLSPNMGDERLFSIFTPFGVIKQAHILRNSYTDDSRNFGYVEFQNKNSALNALNSMRYTNIDGYIMKVNWKKDNPKSLNKEANLYVKNLDDSISEKVLFDYLQEFGDLISVFIRRDANTNRVAGYGYAQFRTVQEARSCIERANGKELNGRSLVIEEFKPRTNRNISKPNNVYVRSIPATIKTEEEAVAFLTQHFGQFGTIISTAASFQQKYGAFNCFVAFKESDAAKKAVAALNGKEVDGTTLFATIAQTKEQRRKAQQNQNMINNQNNFILKSLRQDVTEEEIRGVFSKYGEVGSIAVRKHNFKQSQSGQERPSMNFAFIFFKNAEEAKVCFSKHKSDADITALLHPQHRQNQEFLHYHQNAKVRNRFNKVNNKNKGSTKGYMRMAERYNATMKKMLRMGQRGGRLSPQMLMMLAQMNPMMFQRMMPQQGQMAQMGQMGQMNQMGQMGQMNQMGQMGQMNQMAQMNPMQQQNAMNQQMMMQQQAQAQQAQQQAQQQQQQGGMFSHDWLKNNIETFSKLPQDQQKNILGTLMYQQVSKHAPAQHVPKITGMLIDLDVLGVKEISDILGDNDVLVERINEAIKIIEEDLNRRDGDNAQN